jgi:hypothetical protein
MIFAYLSSYYLVTIVCYQKKARRDPGGGEKNKQNLKIFHICL